MIKILIDGKDVQLIIPGTENDRINPEDHTLEVICEFDDPEEMKGSEICHRFTSEGCIVEGRRGDRVFPITHGMWDQLAADGGMI